MRIFDREDVISLLRAEVVKAGGHKAWSQKTLLRGVNGIAALTFFEIRLILGVMGWDNDPVLVETVVWSCTAMALLIGDIANQLYELSLMRPRRVTRASGLAVPAE